MEEEKASEMMQMEQHSIMIANLIGLPDNKKSFRIKCILHRFLYSLILFS